MPVYEVNYDLSGAPPEDYAALKKAIQSLDSFHDQYSSWYVSYAGSDIQLFDFLAAYTKKKDTLRVSLITELSTKYHVGGYTWLRDHGFQPKAQTS